MNAALLSLVLSESGFALVGNVVREESDPVVLAPLRFVPADEEDETLDGWVTQPDMCFCYGCCNGAGCDFNYTYTAAQRAADDEAVARYDAAIAAGVEGISSLEDFGYIGPRYY